MTWSSANEPEPSPISFWGWGLVILRAIPLLFVLTFGVVLTAFLRVFEYPIFGLRRPVTPHITRFVCRLCLIIIGLRVEQHGEVMGDRGAVVSNHASWLDIFVLNSKKRVYFVSKEEVARWPGIGLLARITGTVFIARDAKQAKQQLTVFEERLLAGHKLLFFPEGTSTDGMRVLPFKTTLFQSFFNEAIREEVAIQPVSIIYSSPPDREERFYGWWGDMGFGEHLIQVLAAGRQGKVKIVYHVPVKVSEFRDRKSLAKFVEDITRSGMPTERQSSV